MTGIAVSDLARRLVRRRAEAMMTATVRINRGGKNGFDPVTGELTGDVGASTTYVGKARIRTVAGDAVVMGEGMLDVVSTLISIPMSAPPPQRDDMVTVVNDDAADGNLAGRVFRVLEVEGGTLISDARRMTCQAAAPSRYWGSTSS